MQLVHLVVLSAVIVPQIPGDCPPQCDCKWKSGKESVICINGNLTRVPAQLDSGTQLLDLTGNQLTAITRDALSTAGLLNLQKVYLAKCRIKLLDRYAFRKLINLVELDLSYNAISAVPSHIFDSISELRELKLSGNPIQRILNEAFVNVPQLVKLELSDCKLGTIEPRAFSGLEHTLEWLKLDKNKISEVRPSTLTSLLSLHGLELANNPWNCSCGLRPLRQWMLSQNIPSGVPAACRSPPRLAGRTWDRLHDDEFACAPTVSPAPGAERVEASEGSNATMACQVTGSPEPAVKWIWKNRPIANVSSPNHKKMYLLHYGESRSSLTILSVEPSDAGVYLCSGANKAGRAEANVTLSVAKRAADSRLPGGRVLLAVVVVASVFGAASCLLYCLLSQPRKEPRGSALNRQESYEKIEMNKKTETRYSDVSVLSKVHPKMNEYRGVPSGEEADGDDEGGTPTSQASDNPRRQPARPTKERSANEQIYLAGGGVGVQQHILRKAQLPTGSLYTTATTAAEDVSPSATNYPDLVVGDPHPTASATLPR
ncbi:hypothetical protein AAG570_003495 [Ranatra chinensis]|uniref:Ig-like domain-containing protein n=1 Tax=Ranatra chinensis TaxID=642074 RepID=A0ABD0Y626_9HEMI